MICFVIFQWLFVQKLWNNLEAVFNTPGTALKFQEEVVKFASIHKRWLKLMKRADETKNVLLCCFGSGEGSHPVMLTEIRQALEHCKKSLSTYLQTKREVKDYHIFTQKQNNKKSIKVKFDSHASM